MIKKSPELIAIAQRWVLAFQEKDRGAIENIFSSSEYLRYIGSDKNEIWSGSIVRNAYADHIDEIPDFKYEQHELEAFESGQTGWAALTGKLLFDGVREDAYIRISWVFVLEGGVWKIIQTHVSSPKSNMELIGTEHTAFDKLIASVKKESDQLNIEGTTTIVFTDIVNSTILTNVVGDRIWSETINWHDKIVSQAISEHGGNLVKTLGDGTMSSFSSARGALMAASSIQETISKSTREPKIEVRIGIHTGDVIKTKGDFLGTVVNKAARIASAAEPCQIFVSDATKAMVGNSSDFCFGNVMIVTLKGLEGGQSIYSLEWKSP